MTASSRIIGVTVFVGMTIDGHADELTAAVADMAAVVAFHPVSGESDHLLEVVVPDLAPYQRFRLDKLLAAGVCEGRSNIALQTQAGASLPLEHLNAAI
jgi:Lrp/AsnC family transcriptional regulator, leucine-responsive regulatory protein